MFHFLILLHPYAEALLHLYELRWLGGDDIMERRLLGALVLTFWNLANSQTVCQRQSNGRCHGICKLRIQMLYLCCSKKRQSVWPFGCIDTYRRGVCVARFDKLGNARASKRETSNRYRFSRFSFKYNKVSTGDTHAESGELIGK